MAPSDALDAVNQENMVRVKDKVVHEARGVGYQSSVLGLARQSPLSVESDRMALGDSQTISKCNQRLASVPRNLGDASYNCRPLGSDNSITLPDLGNRSCSLPCSIHDHDSRGLSEAAST